MWPWRVAAVGAYCPDLHAQSITGDWSAPIASAQMRCSGSGAGEDRPKWRVRLGEDAERIATVVVTLQALFTTELVGRDCFWGPTAAVAVSTCVYASNPVRRPAIAFTRARVESGKNIEGFQFDASTEGNSVEGLTPSQLMDGCNVAAISCWRRTVQT